MPRVRGALAVRGGGVYDVAAMAASALTDAQILAELKSIFGYAGFRPLQRDIVRASLDGRDVFVLMPTGGGKSLCYQLPALLRDGLTVVVSPLIALMKDQVDKLLAMGVAATFVNSSLDSAEIGRRQRAAARGAVKLLYVAPERLMLPQFLDLLSSVRLAGFAIDEAHCISEWGHDFRPEYRELKRLRALFPKTALAAFTATATRRVQADIAAQLGLEDAATFQGSFDRPNLFYEVRPKQGAYDQMTDYLRARGPGAGIVYCQARSATEDLAARLQTDGFSAAAYHAGLSSDERRRRQDAFVKDQVQIIVATIAFGMGIDKPDVRFVIHYDLPKNLEGYYQESGRAGRDGDPSDCILFYGYGDRAKHEHFIRQKPSATEREVASRQLHRMVGWAAGGTCRRRTLLAYFDEPHQGGAERCCDVCREPVEQVDYTTPSQMLLSCAKRTGERFGSAHLIDILRGSRRERVLRLRHDELSTYGLDRDRSREEWQYLAHELLQRGYIRQAEEDFNAVKVTARGRAVLFEGERVLLPAMRRPASRAPAHTAEPHQALFDRLRALRRRLAKERGVPPYVIFYDVTLRQMAAELPTERARLAGLQGVGERKLVDFGDAFLAAIAEYVGETNARPVAPSPRPANGTMRGATRGPRLGDSAGATLALFRQGHDIPAIMEVRGLARSTVEGHLAAAMEAGEDLELGRLVSEEKARAIRVASRELGSAALTPLLERLGDGYTYAECRFVRAAMRDAAPTAPLELID